MSWPSDFHERGVTGFRDVNDPELPVVDVRLFRAGCYAGAQAAGGAVEQIVERTYPRNFHSASIGVAADRFEILCHFGYPWIAFIEEGTGSWADPGVFVDPPVWAAVFAETGFTVMSRDLLDSPLSEVDPAALTKAEWSQIVSWRPASVGQTLFNSWD
jgi:hypothetical protein